MLLDVRNVVTELSTRLELEEWFSLKHVKLKNKIRNPHRVSGIVCFVL